MAYISINFDNYRHNLELLAKKAGDINKVIAVLKDNAYGHGLLEMAPLAAAVGVKWAAVKNKYEASIVEPFFERVLILVDVPSSEVNDKWVFAAHSLESIAKMPEGTTIHLKVDTGMHRNGVMMNEVDEACALIHEKKLNIEGAMMHHSSADIVGTTYFVQKENFEMVKQRLQEFSSKYGFKDLKFHSCNSAALLRHEGSFDEDFARVGIASYGYTDLPSAFGTYDLKPVLSLWAEKVSTRMLEKGDRVGYGGVFEAPKAMRVSTYDIGYGDGFSRYDGKSDLAIADGRPILGRVSMDSLSIEGNDDKVCLFKDARGLASHFNTISYEIVTKLATWIVRKVEGSH